MAKYSSSRKAYKSTTFVPSKKRVKLRPISYQDQVITTLKEKFTFFLVGIGVLLGLITGSSYLVLKSASKSTVVAQNIEKRIDTAVTQVPTVEPTVEPSKVVTVSAKPSEVVDRPKVDPTKAAQAAASTPGKGTSTYVVKPGDTLWKIAERVYKSGFNYKDVVAYNKIGNPNSLLVGQEILLPTVVPDLPTDPTVLAQGGVGGPAVQGEIGEAAMTSAVTNTDPAYTVVKGDTLWSIAERTYGDGFSWKDIAKMNNVSDPTKLEPGTVLQIKK